MVRLVRIRAHTPLIHGLTHYHGLGALLFVKLLGLLISWGHKPLADLTHEGAEHKRRHHNEDHCGRNKYLVVEQRNTVAFASCNINFTAFITDLWNLEY